MSSSESILFLLGVEMAAERPDEYHVHADPTPVLADLRGSEPPPPPSARGGDDAPPSSRLPPSSRARGSHVPSVFDVVEFGVPSPRTATRLEQVYEHRPLDHGMRVMAQNPNGMREAISNIAVDDRDGPASNRIAVQERIQNRQRIRELADTLVRYRSVGVINSAYHAPMHVRAAVLYRQANALCWELTQPFPPPPFVIEVVGVNSVFQWYITAASMRDGLMLTPLPSEVVRLRRRWGRRTNAPEGCAVTLRLEGDEEVVRRCAMRDISFTGLSFWKDPDDDALHPDTKIAWAEISAPDEVLAHATGELSFVARDSDGKGDLCGVRLDIADPAQRTRWREFVSRCLHPTTRLGQGYYDAIWELYQHAGYFNLSGKDPAHFDKLRDCFFANATNIDATPDLGCLVAWPVEQKALATISMLKTYHGSWFVYQLAKVRGDAPDGTTSRQVLRDVHLRAYEHAQLDPDLAWIIAYPQVLDPPIWSHSVHYDLPRRFTTAGLACVVRFRALEMRCEAAPPAYEEAPPALEIDRATPEEIDTFLRWLREVRPRPYVEAYDLTPERIDLGSNKRFWSSLGMARDREIRVARHKGLMVAVAVLEDAQEGLHLFRLLDLIRPFCLTRNASLGAFAVDALIDSAKPWFRARSKSAFCAFIEDDTWVTPALRATVEDMGQADTTILSATLLPELLEHLIDVTAPRGGH
jgi:hypothetical protein